MAKTTEEKRLGQLLVQKQCCRLWQVNQALAKQDLLRAQNRHVPLGRLLLEGGVVEEETLREVLAELGVLQLSCPTCRKDYPMPTYLRGTATVCPECKTPLVLLDRVPTKDSATRVAQTKVKAADSPLEKTQSPPPGPVPAEAVPAQTPPSGDAFVGKVLGGCQILQKLAQGGMGVVYKAKQLNLGRTVAVKVLSHDLANDPNFVRRFQQEARSAGQLSHGNIVHINDCGEFQGVVYYVMEFVEGKNLKEILKGDSKIDVARGLDIITQVCHALRHAHNRGIIHRDIKPENIMITEEGVVKLADLGLAKRMASDNSAGLTHAGAIFGTPFYMAPEQAKDFSKVDRRSDIYSLGVTFFRMLTGRVPFDGRSPIEVMIKAIDGRKTPIHEFRDDVPPELEAIIDRMMDRSPDKRHQDVDELLRDLAPVVAAVGVPQTA